LFPKGTLRSLAGKIVPLLCHPGAGIRFGAIAFISTVASLFSPADSFSLLLPLVRPLLSQPIVAINEVSLLKALKPPLTRPMLDQARVFAGRIAQRQRQPAVSDLSAQQQVCFYHLLKLFSLFKKKYFFLQDELTVGSPISAPGDSGSIADDEFRRSVRNLALNPDEETKLLLMQDLIFRKRGGLRAAMYQGPGPTLPASQQQQQHQVVASSSSSVISSVGSVASSGLPTFMRDASASFITQASSTVDDQKGFVSLRLMGVPIRRGIVSPQVRRGSHNASTLPSPQIGDGGPLSSGSSTPLQSNFPSAASLARRATSGAQSIAAETLAALHQQQQHPTLQAGGISSVRLLPSNGGTAVFTTPNSTGVVTPGSAPSSGGAAGGIASSGLPPLATTITNPTALAAAALTTASSAAESAPVATLPLTFSDPATPIEEAWLVSQHLNRRLTTHRRIGSKSNFSSGQPASQASWRPEGVLVANLHEHYDPIICIRASPDGNFFLTASHDNVKLWDIQKFDKHQSNKSKSVQIFSSIVSVIFLENSLTYLVSTQEGFIHLCRYNQKKKEKKKEVSLFYVFIFFFLLLESKWSRTMHRPSTSANSRCARAMPFGWSITSRGKSRCWCTRRVRARSLQWT